MKIAYLTNAGPASGVGHYAHSLKNRLLKEQSLQMTEFNLSETSLAPWPGMLGSKSIGWIRSGRRLKSQLSQFDIVHATNQTLSFLKPAKPFIITVHDIIELLQPQDKRAYFINKYLYSGISKASKLIAVSQYTKQTIQEYYGLPDEKITVIHNGVDETEFYPIEHFEQTIGYQTLRQELTLSDHHPIVLYVGSEHPRKNVGTALKAFANLCSKRPDAIFIKVGAPGIASGRAQFLDTVDELGIKDSVRIVNSASQLRLNEFYNIADVFIYPSKFEGFGMPPLQAMFAGTPVVCSNATSLPEIVGTAALTHESDDVDGFTASLLAITSDNALKDKLITTGQAQAKKFSWDENAVQTLAVYKQLV